jgi:hypothetical protein
VLINVDGIVVVTRANLTRAATLDELPRVLDVAPALPLGFILTGSRDVGGYYEAGYGHVTRDFTASQGPGIDIDAQRNTERCRDGNSRSSLRRPISSQARYASTRAYSYGGSL